MSVGVYQHICRGVSCGALNSFHIAARDHQLIGCTGMPQTVEHNTRELRVCIYKDHFCSAKYLLGTPKPLNCIRWMQAA